MSTNWTKIVVNCFRAQSRWQMNVKLAA